ncbi:MAG: hypothetical protein AAF797_17880, partial [Planctomycetota bacterium]
MPDPIPDLWQASRNRLIQQRPQRMRNLVRRCAMIKQARQRLAPQARYDRLARSGADFDPVGLRDG